MYVIYNFYYYYYAYVKGGGGGNKTYKFCLATCNEACLGYMGILDICVNNQSRGYGVFKLNFRDILNYFMLIITGILCQIFRGYEIFVPPLNKPL